MLALLNALITASVVVLLIIAYDTFPFSLLVAELDRDGCANTKGAAPNVWANVILKS